MTAQIVYRRKYNIPSEWGTAVNVQAMVFGNTASSPAPGGVHARPATGEKVFYGEFLINAQGEDVVAGCAHAGAGGALKNHLPKAFAELEKVRATLERISKTSGLRIHHSGRQAFHASNANGKRTGLRPSLRSRNGEGEADRLEDGDQRVSRDQLDQVLAPVFDREGVKARKSSRKACRRSGRRFRKDVSQRRARRRAAAKGERCLLVRNETSPKICAA
jgi:pyruvate,orthophosphate dikinase